MPDYKELGFYQKAREVIRGVDQLIRTWPKTMQAQEVSRQLFRAATSVGANIAEGHGRHRGLEYIHFLTIAQGLANEVDPWLMVASDCQISLSEEHRRLVSLNNETRKMLRAALNTLQNQKDKSLRENPIPYSPVPYFPDEENE